MKLLVFEFKKMFFSKKFLVLLAFLVALVVLLFFRNVIFEDYVLDEKQSEYNYLIEVSEMNAGHYDRQLEQYLEEGTEEYEEIEMRQEMNLELLSTANELRSLVGTDDWQRQLNVEISFMEQVRDYRMAEGEYPISEEEIRHTIAMNHQLLAQGIPNEIENYSQAPPNFLLQVVNLWVMLGALVVVLLLIGDLMTSEFESRSINLLFTQPFNRAHIIVSKFVSSLVIYLIVLVAVLLTALGVSHLFGTEGHFQYPVIIEVDGVLRALTAVDYVVQAVGLMSVMVIFMISLYLLYSLLFKQTIMTLFALLGTLLLGYILTATFSMDALAWFNPFKYVLPEQAILTQENERWFDAIPVTLIVSVVLLFIASRKIKTSKVD
ncbi:ABC transporter permease [Alkalibacillus haloalkaliphilus]|uniref:ABC transporter permease n=1 Tax=Alkalibacillus haloalkaliphilus TaxID=94136 RepID=UPI0029365694|nr:ABC transporter permease [Alkalibacillus haloalkaliphilus]MDV2583504.1 ABC transporter permease [Alkalibacillus haloalkaliphilus]